MTVLQWVTAVGVIFAAVVSWFNHRRIQEVHVLVNSQLHEVMQELVTRTQERDTLQQEKDESDLPK